VRRVLGVDPGSAATGWALVRSEGNRYCLEELGVIRMRGDDRPRRLAELERRFSELLERLRPVRLGEIEDPNRIGTVVGAVTGADTTIVNLTVKPFRIVVAGINRTDRLAGGIIAMLAEHR